MLDRLFPLADLGFDRESILALFGLEEHGALVVTGPVASGALDLALHPAANTITLVAFPPDTRRVVGEGFGLRDAPRASLVVFEDDQVLCEVVALEAL